MNTRIDENNAGPKFGSYFWLGIIIGATSTIDFSLIGRVTVAELIMCLSLPFMVFRTTKFYRTKHFVQCASILALMIFSVLTAEFIHRNYFDLTIRALARPMFIAMYMLFFIGLLSRGPRGLVGVAYGMILAGAYRYLRPSTFEDAGTMDMQSYAATVFRVQPLLWGVCVAGAVMLYTKNRLFSAISILVYLIAVVALGGSRHSIPVAGGIIMTFVLIHYLKGRSKRIVLSTSQLALMFSGLVFVLFVAYGAYYYAAPRGYLGADQQDKFQQQSKTIFGNSPPGLILAGRPQVYAAVLAALDQPFFGYGAWRYDKTEPYVVDAISSVGTDTGMINSLRSGRVGAGGAGHSVLFQAWVESGIFYAISYILVLVIALKVLLDCLQIETQMTPFIVCYLFYFFWDYLFSPPSITVRFTIGLIFAYYVVVMRYRRKTAQQGV